MRRLVFAILAPLAAAAFSARAADNAGLSAPVTLEALQDAAAAVKPFADARWAFSWEIKARGEDGAEETQRLRFDPRRKSGERWTALEPQAAALSRNERRRLKDLNKKADDADKRLVYAKADELTSHARLESETAGEAVFLAPLTPDKEMSAEMAAALEARFYYDKRAGFIRKVSIRSISSFKPAPIARVDKYAHEQVYAKPQDGLPPLMIETKDLAEGSALGRAFHSEAEIRYFDIERVTAP